MRRIPLFSNSVITRDSQHTADRNPPRAQAGAVLGHDMAKSKKAAAETIGVSFKAPDELTLPISSKPDPRLIVLVRIIARQAARDFVQAACDGQERNSRHQNISEKQHVSMESTRPINRHLRRDACAPPLDDEDDQIARQRSARPSILRVLFFPCTKGCAIVVVRAS